MTMKTGSGQIKLITREEKRSRIKLKPEQYLLQEINPILVKSQLLKINKICPDRHNNNNKHYHFLFVYKLFMQYKAPEPLKIVID